MEVRVGYPLPNIIVLKDATGGSLEQHVEYEWVPMSCKNSGVFGHMEARCKKKQNVSKQVWVVKEHEVTAINIIFNRSEEIESHSKHNRSQEW